jgi:cobalt-zinc-cadmium efflux system outer membrane protein
LSNPAALVTWLERTNPEVRAALARVRQADAQVGTSRLWQNPTLDLGLNGIPVGRRNASIPSNADTKSVTVGVSQTVELGKRGPRVEAAKLHRDSAAESYRDSLLTLLSSSRAAMTRVVYLGTRQHILEEGLESARSVADLAKIRLDKGDVSGVDHSRLVLEAAHVERDVEDNRSDLEDALGDCQTILLAPCAADAATLEAAEHSASADFDHGDVARALENRPDLRALGLEQRAAQAEATMHRRSAIPDPTVGVNYTRDFYEVAGNQPHTLGVSLSIPLPFFDHGQYQALEAEHRSEELSATLRASSIRAQFDARSLLIRRRVLAQKLDNISHFALPRSKDVVASSTAAYERGQISMTDLLLARREHASLLLEEADTRFALFSVENDLRHTLGMDLETLGRQAPEDS